MNTKRNNQILGLQLNTDSSELVLEQIIRGLTIHREFAHVVSLNPENVVLSTKDPQFRHIISEAKYTINDGVGTVLASRLLNGAFVPRLTGVDLMQNLLKMTSKESLRVLLVGGKPNLAEELADCYSRSYPASSFKGVVGFSKVKSPAPDEQKKLLSIVAAVRPHLMFVAFGSPEQEKWIYQNRASLQGVTCIGVGGAFDFIGGRVGRAPRLIQKIGLEWLFRLVKQPWRWKRQLRLVEFVWLVLKEKIS